jgi:hypothetical protein
MALEEQAVESGDSLPNWESGDSLPNWRNQGGEIRGQEIRGQFTYPRNHAYFSQSESTSSHSNSQYSQ